VLTPFHRVLFISGLLWQLSKLEKCVNIYISGSSMDVFSLAMLYEGSNTLPTSNISKYACIFYCQNLAHNSSHMRDVVVYLQT